MPRPNRPPSRQRLIETAAELFYTQGIHNTGVDTIVARAGLTKPTLYKHFRSKDDLVAAVLQMRSDNWRAALSGYVDRASTPRTRLLAVFEFLHDFVEDRGFRGCALINAAVELPDPLNRGREIARANKRWNRQLLERLVREASLPRRKQLAGALLLLFEGAIVTSYVEGEATAAGHARKAAEQLIAGS